jgi:hypothetical protein
VDADLLQTAQEAVKAGHAESLSAWVNDALRLKADHERRMAALDAFVTAYEAEHGVITGDEIDGALHRARGRAVVVRSSPPAKRSRSRRGVA